MSKIRTAYHRIAVQSPGTKLAIGTTVTLASVFALCVGVGAASLQQTVAVALNGKNANPIMIGAADSNGAPTTLKVEIVRDGSTICQGENTPQVNSAFDRFSIERPIADCPKLQVGDTVRATWIQQNEVKISFRD